jgi:thiamine biosynthesis protein ThiS
MRSGLGPQVAFSILVCGFKTQTVNAETKSIQIVVNGQLQPAASRLSLTELLSSLGVDPSRVAVELNRCIVRREDWDKTEVADGATLEIVQFVGGG